MTCLEILRVHVYSRYPANRLLGSAAFASVFIVMLTTPLNRIISKRSIRVQKGLSTARDNRMSVVNELISAVCHTAFSSPPFHSSLCMHQVKFIKFFAWEDRWIKRVSDTRRVELQWLVKGVSLTPVAMTDFTHWPRQSASTRYSSRSSGRASQF